MARKGCVLLVVCLAILILDGTHGYDGDTTGVKRVLRRANSAPLQSSSQQPLTAAPLPLASKEDPGPRQPPDSDSKTAAVAAASTGTPKCTNPTNEQKILYIRHGKSTGNAWKFWRAGDGVLTEKGEEQADTRVEQMSKEEVEEMLTVDVVLVSPLTRAMETAMAMYAHAFARAKALGSNMTIDDVCKTFIVEVDLREKVKSGSDKPGVSWWHSNPYKAGMGGMAKAVMDDFRDRLKEVHPNSTEYITAVYQALNHSYAEKFTALETKPEHSQNSVDFSRQVLQFRKKLHNEYKAYKSIACVAHSGLSKYMLGALLPKGDKKGFTDLWPDQLMYAGRFVTPFKNCGGIRVCFRSDTDGGKFVAPAPLAAGDPLSGTRFPANPASYGKLPVYKTDEADWAPMSRETDYQGGQRKVTGGSDEVSDAAHFPADAEVKVFLLKKWLSYTQLGAWPRRVVVSYSAARPVNGTHITWGKLWGKPTKGRAKSAPRIKSAQITKNRKGKPKKVKVTIETCQATGCEEDKDPLILYAADSAHQEDFSDFIDFLKHLKVQGAR